MKRTLLLSALIAVALTACGKKEEAAAPAAVPAPQAEAPAQPATPTETAPAAAEQKPEENK
jgi:uncharacterized lipoprotein YbaY